jgi:hypothetical protein
MLREVDRKSFKKLGVGLTCDPVKKLIVSRKEEEEI